MRTRIASLRFACYFDLYNISMYVYYVEVVFNFVATVPSQSCAFTVLIATYFMARRAIPIIAGSNYIYMLTRVCVVYVDK